MQRAKRRKWYREILFANPPLEFYYANTEISASFEENLQVLESAKIIDAFWDDTLRSFIEYYIKAAARRLRYPRAPREDSQEDKPDMNNLSAYL